MSRCLICERADPTDLNNTTICLSCRKFVHTALVEYDGIPNLTIGRLYNYAIARQHHANLTKQQEQAKAAKLNPTDLFKQDFS